MELTKLDDDLDVIQKLDDEPNDVAGLTAAELKAMFDSAPNAIKAYINGTLIPGIVALLEALDNGKASRAELQGVVLNQIPDGTVGTSKLAEGAVTEEKLDPELAAAVNSHVKMENYRADHLPVSDALAESAGLAAPAAAESVLRVLNDRVGDILEAVSGTSAKNRWNMYRWGLVGVPDKLTASGSSADSASFYLRTANGVSVGQDGTAALVDPVELGAVTALPSAGAYIQAKSLAGAWGDIYLVTEETAAKVTVGLLNGEPQYTRTWSNLSRQAVYSEYLGRVEGESESAYPEDGWVGDIRYVRETALRTKIAQIQTLEHEGSGGYGQTAPTAFVFDFPPRLLAAFTEAGQLVSDSLLLDGPWLLAADGLGTEYRTVAQHNDDVLGGKRSEDGKTVYFYATAGAKYQLNDRGRRYRIVGIG